MVAVSPDGTSCSKGLPVDSLTTIREHLQATVSPGSLSVISTRLSLTLGFGIISFPPHLDRDPTTVAKVTSTLVALGIKLS